MNDDGMDMDALDAKKEAQLISIREGVATIATERESRELRDLTRSVRESVDGTGQALDGMEKGLCNAVKGKFGRKASEQFSKQRKTLDQLK